MCEVVEPVERIRKLISDLNEALELYQRDITNSEPKPASAESEWMTPNDLRFYICPSKDHEGKWIIDDIPGVYYPDAFSAQSALNALGEASYWKRVSPLGCCRVWIDKNSHFYIGKKDLIGHYVVRAYNRYGAAIIPVELAVKHWGTLERAVSDLDSYASAHHWIFEHYTKIE